MGYGGGYYDRYLNKLPKKIKNLLTIGLAFSFQEHNKIPISNSDVKLNYVLTEKVLFNENFNFRRYNGNICRKALDKNLPDIISKNEIDFTVINGENAADDGKGITNSIADKLYSIGVDVITSGNHIWDKQETVDYINKERRLLRPANLAEGFRKWLWNFYDKNKNIKLEL